MDEKNTTQSQSVSTIGSTQGNVTITANDKLHIGGADLVANKDINLTGDSVQIDPGFDKRTRTETFESKQSGLSVALSGTVGSSLNTAVSTAQQARKESDGRLSALQGTKAVLSGVQAGLAYQQDSLTSQAADAKNAAIGVNTEDAGAEKGATNTIGVSVSYGSQSSKSETHTESTVSQGSTLNAGQNIAITATGKNKAQHSGDIAIEGSQLKAGNEISLNAAKDIHLTSAENTESTQGHNSSKGGSVGVGLGIGEGGAGVNLSASVNAGKGRESGNGVTHTETTLDAGNKIKLNSERDTTLKGAQVNSEQVTANVGRNLTLESEQNSDRYDAKQQDISVGGGYTLGSNNPTLNLSASKDKLHSNYDSVKEQTGIFAGKGGFDVTVKEHIQLDGAVIASTSNKDKNRLETGTLGWSDIHNKAEFEASHSGGSISTGGPLGKDLLNNMAGGILSGANNQGNAQGTTQAAVSDGKWLVRDTDNQKQDITQLSRDTEHANDGSINPIFDKEKEQNRLKQAQLMGEIGNQAMDIIRTQGDIAGLKEAQAKHPNLSVSELRETKEYNHAMERFGTGSDLQKAAQAVTGALTALSGNNLSGALASGASPYLATEIKKLTTVNGEVNVAANALAHTILGAVTAELNNQSAVAGGLGAGGGELAARFIAKELFSNKDISELTESEKQQVSALSQLAAGLAGGISTGNIEGAVTAAQTGKNAVENNALSDLVEAQAAGKTPQKVAEERVNAEIERYKKENCAGMSAGACSAKMAEDRDKFFREAASLGIDFVPVVGDFKSFADADDWIDYTLAAAGTLPFAKVFTKPLKEAKLLLKAGDLDGANKLIKEASDGIPTKLPSSPASQSSSGVWKPDHGVEVNTGSGKQKDLESSSQPPQNTGNNHQRPPRNATNLAGGPLERAQQVSGRFQIENGPKNGTVYRADNQGNITSYATYDSNGMILKRVDVTGAAHGGIATPHVIEYGRNVLPNGQVRVQSPSTKSLPRPVREDEIP